MEWNNRKENFLRSLKIFCLSLNNEKSTEMLLWYHIYSHKQTIELYEDSIVLYDQRSEWSVYFGSVIFANLSISKESTTTEKWENQQKVVNYPPLKKIPQVLIFVISTWKCFWVILNSLGHQEKYSCVYTMLSSIPKPILI